MYEVEKSKVQISEVTYMWYISLSHWERHHGLEIDFTGVWGGGGAAVELIQNIYSKILLILYSLFLSTNKFRRLSFFFFQNYDARAKVSFSIIYSKIKLYKHRKHINHAHTHLRIKITSINTFYVA